MNQRYQKDFIQAGKLAGEVRAFGKGLIIPGASYVSVLSQIEAKIRQLGARPAFPPQMALNNVAAHFLLPPGEDLHFSDELVKLDVGVCYNGAIGDCAVTVDLSGKYQGLVDAAEAALGAAEGVIQVGAPICDIGRAIENAISSRGYSPVRNLAGHGLGYFQVHTHPSIPNYDDKSKGVIKAGMTFAVEPFATDGKGLIYVEGKATIFSLLRARSQRTPIAKALLAAMRTFNGLPFSIHDLSNKGYSSAEVQQCLDDMINEQVIEGYPPLLEVSKGMVAQAENSILIDNDGVVTITTRV